METKGFRPDPVSAASTSNSSQDTNTSSSLHRRRTKPTCARCRNHGLSFPVKGHKSSCQLRNCPCVMCYVVAEGGRFRAMQLAMWRGREKQFRKTDRNTSSQNESCKSPQAATSPVPGNDSNAVEGKDALLSLYGCCSVQNLSTSSAPNASRNIIPPPQHQHQLTRRYHQDFERYTPLNAADTIVEERRKSLSSSISIIGKTQTVLPSDKQNNPFSIIPPEQLSYMTNHSVTIPQPQPKSQLSIPCSERFTNSGPFTTAPALVTDTCSIKNGSDSLSSSGSTSGESGYYTDIASSIIQPPQQYLQLPPACCHYAPQLQAVTPMTDLLPMIDGSGSVSSSSTTNTTVPNVPNVCMHTPGGTIPPPDTNRQFSLLCKNRFATCRPRNIVEAPVTDFRSIDSLSSSFTCKTSRTMPVIPSAWTNDGSTSITQRQPVMRQTQWSCGNLPSCGASGTPYYDTLIRQYGLNSLFLKGP